MEKPNIDEIISLLNSRDFKMTTKAAYQLTSLNYEEDIPLDRFEELVSVLREAADWMFNETRGNYSSSNLQVLDTIHKKYYSIANYAMEVGVIQPIK